jgi:pectate lyase
MEEEGFRWSRAGSFVLFYLVLFLSAAVSSEANIGDFDDYWRQRKLMADAAAEATYKHDPLEVTNQLNRAVHRQFSRAPIHIYASHIDRRS